MEFVNFYLACLAPHALLAYYLKGLTFDILNAIPACQVR